MRIRPATVDDGLPILAMAERFLAETPYGEIVPTTSDRLAELIGTVLKIGIIFVAEQDLLAACGHCFVLGLTTDAVDQPKRCPWCQGAGARRPIVGMLAIVAVTHPLTGLSYGDELAWWVEPEHRRGSVGPRLLAAGERWAIETGVRALKIAAPVASADAVDVSGFLARRGYMPIETAHQKTFPPAGA